MPADVDHDAVALVRRLSSISGGLAMRSIEANRQLLLWSAEHAVSCLDNVMHASCNGNISARVALRAVLHAFDQSPSLATQLLDAAQRMPCVLVASVLLDGEAAQTYSLDASRRADATLLKGSLGHLKTAARVTRRPDELARLTQSAEPSVMREILQNPRLTESLVVRIAARRPARPEPLLEIFRSEKWSSRLPVLRALAFNPYTSLFVAHRTVALLMKADWNEIAQSSELSPKVRECARRFSGRF
jgi:hypothetical protein